MSKLGVMGWITMILTVIGALNWGLVGFFNWNLVGAILMGDMSTASRVVYAIVGLSALYVIYMLVKGDKTPEVIG